MAVIASLCTMIATASSRGNKSEDSNYWMQKVSGKRNRKKMMLRVGVTKTSRLDANNGIRESPGEHKEGGGSDLRL